MSFLLLTTALLLSAPADLPAPVRLSAPMGDDRAILEVRNLPSGAATAAIRDAVERMRQLATLLDPDAHGQGGVGDLEAGDGEPRPVRREILPLVASSLGFCYWSEGAWGPLGGSLAELWRSAAASGSPPTDRQRVEAARTAACDNARVDGERSTLALAPGTRLDLSPFVAGFLVDRAVDTLREQGATNGYVELGPVRRGFGPGPGGHGWQVALDPIQGLPGIDNVWLRDRALAVVHRDVHPFLVQDVVVPRLLDQRPARQVLSDSSALSPRAVVAVAVSSTLASDAQALAGALFVLGSSSGQIYLGSVEPEPSVLWLLGDAAGAPALMTHRWSDLLR